MCVVLISQASHGVNKMVPIKRLDVGDTDCRKVMLCFLSSLKVTLMAALTIAGWPL